MGRGDAVRLWTRGRLRRVTAPEGRAREEDALARASESGEPRRLREAGLRCCDPRRSVEATRWLRPRLSSMPARLVFGSARRGSASSTPATGSGGTAGRTPLSGATRAATRPAVVSGSPVRCSASAPGPRSAPLRPAGRRAHPPVTPAMEGSPGPPSSRLPGFGSKWRGCQLTPQRSSDRSGGGLDAASDERAPARARAPNWG